MNANAPTTTFRPSQIKSDVPQSLKRRSSSPLCQQSTLKHRIVDVKPAVPGRKSMPQKLSLSKQIYHAAHPDFKGYHSYAFQLRSQSAPLCKLLNSAHKVVSTRDWQLAREESKQLKVLTRIDELKAQNMWSLRQMKATLEPKREAAHWDYLLEEMKWMSEDFREERRWKIGMSYTIAQWVMDWHTATDKSSLCINRSNQKLQRHRSSISIPADIDNSQDIMPITLTNLPPVELENSNILEVNHSQSADLLPTSSVENANPQQITIPEIEIDFEKSIYFFKEQQQQLAAAAYAPASSALSKAPVYGPPPFPTDTFPTPLSLSDNEFEGIVPFSNLFQDRLIAKDVSRWDEYGRLKSEWGEFDCSSNTDDADAAINALIFRESPLFGKVEESLSESIPTPQTQTSPINANSSNSSDQNLPPAVLISHKPVVWIPDEDTMLIKLVTDTGYNWRYIAEALTTLRLTGEKRTEWDCYSRYKAITETKAGADNGTGERLRQIRAGSAMDMGKRFGKRLAIFEFILIQSRVRQEKQMRKPDQQLQKKVSLTSHDTHKQAQDNAGVNLSADPLLPGDISTMKEKREYDNKIQQNVRMMSNRMMPGMPMPGIPLMRPNTIPQFMQYPATGQIPHPMQFRPMMPQRQASALQIQNTPGTPSATAVNVGNAPSGMQRIPSVNTQMGNMLTPEQLQQQMNANARRMMLQPGALQTGTASPIPEVMNAPQQQFQINQMQMLAARQMMQQQIAAVAAANGGVVTGSQSPGMVARPINDAQQQAAAMMALQNAASGRGQMPLDPRQLVMIQQHQQQMMAAISANAAAAAVASATNNINGSGSINGTSNGGTGGGVNAGPTVGSAASGLSMSPSVSNGNLIVNNTVGNNASTSAQSTIVAGVNTVAPTSKASNSSPVAPTTTKASNRKLKDESHSTNTVSTPATKAGRGSRSVKASPVVKNAITPSRGSKKEEKPTAAEKRARKKKIEDSEEEEEEEEEEEVGEEEEEANGEEDEEEEVKPASRRVSRRESAAAAAAVITTPAAPARRGQKRK
ncbi:chromatin modification- protein VID21 [Physocladia obscura]|uniref:Vacuolar import and degradation protein 21 n=1 Tax=Physocladia obscura TaxID=109957 RepID=A0AAD5XK88_9FUNG|nr:chromatin modification- protein VID21 [Physocladia obscura]